MKSKLKNIGIHKLLFIGFGLAIAAIVFLTYTAWNGFDGIVANATSVMDRAQKVNEDMKSVSSGANQASADSRLLTATVEKKMLPTAKSSVQDMVIIEDTFEQLITTFNELIEQDDLDVDDFVMELEDILDTIKRENMPMVRSLRSNTQQASTQMQDAAAVLKKFEAGLKTFVSKAKEATAASTQIVNESKNAQQGAVNTNKWMIITAVVVTVLLIVFSIIITNIIIGPIRVLADGMKDISEGEGDLTRRIIVESKDELGELAKWFNVFLENIRNIIIDIANNSGALADSSKELTSVSSQLAGRSEQMSDQATKVNGVSEHMSLRINSMASAVEEASVNSASVSSTAGEMSGKMNTMASSITQISTSISEVAKNARETSEVANRANEMAHNTTKTVRTLGDSANEIGAVTDMIKRIAEQTNLLALNATIEAASAGDAGKGFAVVANEIKELANQSAQAAEDITGKIEGIQERTNEAVTAISDVLEIIGKISESVEVISQSVDQQTQTTREISSNVTEVTTGADNIALAISEVAKGASDISENAHEAASGATEVTSNIQEISKAVVENNEDIKQIDSSTNDLARIAGELQAMVGRFKVEENGDGEVKQLEAPGQVSA